MTLDDVKAAAAILEQETALKGIDHAYDALSAQLKFVSTQIDIATYLPGGAKSTLGMAAKRPDGRSFFEAFRKNFREKLCEEGGDFAEFAKAGTHYTVTGLVVIVSRAINLPDEGLLIVGPIAVLLSVLGIKSFCEVSLPDQ